MTINIFVYGSLRKGEYNHPHSGMDKFEFVGTVKTAPLYTLRNFGSYPGLYADGKTSVVGEIYRVDDSVEQQEILKRIENMELGAGYTRQEILLLEPQAEPVFGWVTSADKYRVTAPEVTSGDWVLHNTAAREKQKKEDAAWREELRLAEEKRVKSKKARSSKKKATAVSSS